MAAPRPTTTPNDPSPKPPSPPAPKPPTTAPPAPPPSSTTTATTTTTSIISGNATGGGGDGNGMSGGGIAGLVAGIILVFVGSIVGGFFLLKQRRKRLMLVGRNTRNYNGYPEPDLDRPMAPFRREGRPSSGYVSNSGYGVLPPGGRRLHAESGIFNDKSYHADAAGLGGARMTHSGFGSTHSIGGESYTQMNNGMLVATGRRDGDAPPTSPLSPGHGSGIESGENRRVNSTQSMDLDPEQLERERQLDLQQQARLLSMAGGEPVSPSSPSSHSSSSPTSGSPHPYPQPPPMSAQPMNQAAFRGPGGDAPPHFQRPNSYYPHPYDPRGGYQHQQYVQGGPRPQSQFYPQQQNPYYQYSLGSQTMRPMAQFQPGSVSNPNLPPNLANEKQEFEQSELASTAAMSSISRLSGSEHSSQNTAVATPIFGATVNNPGKISQEPHPVVSGSEGVALNDTNNNSNNNNTVANDASAAAADKEEYRASLHGDPSAAVVPPPLVNSTKPTFQ
ncbi:hypothetical protein BGX26_000623 [Mortierella sp. AD094]|nr:hypothetical protein BGX26_000623 [Mortierella sp. AD094]